MIYTIKKLDKKTYQVINRLTKRGKGPALTSQTEAQRVARIYERERLRRPIVKEVRQ